MEMKEAMAGTLESGDILVQISPADAPGLQKVITETLEGLDIRDAHVKATDKGALDCTIRARVTAAAVRATGVDVWK